MTSRARIVELPTTPPEHGPYRQCNCPTTTQSRVRCSINLSSCLSFQTPCTTKADKSGTLIRRSPPTSPPSSPASVAKRSASVAARPDAFVSFAHSVASASRSPATSAGSVPSFRWSVLSRIGSVASFRWSAFNSEWDVVNCGWSVLRSRRFDSGGWEMKRSGNTTASVVSTRNCADPLVPSSTMLISPDTSSATTPPKQIFACTDPPTKRERRSSSTAGRSGVLGRDLRVARLVRVTFDDLRSFELMRVESGDHRAQAGEATSRIEAPASMSRG